jgi:hypothetical protein
MRLQNGKVQEDIADRMIIGDQKAEPARDVEPFDHARMALVAGLKVNGDYRRVHRHGGKTARCLLPFGPHPSPP